MTQEEKVDNMYEMVKRLTRELPEQLKALRAKTDEAEADADGDGDAGDEEGGEDDDEVAGQTAENDED